jgi:ketosteroid isomerase-like protein
MTEQSSRASIPPSAGSNVSGVATLLNRNLPEVFGEGEPSRRRAAIRELYTEDCVYVPPGVFVGHDALDKFAGDLRAAYTGVDFIIVRDGKIAALYVYLDSPPT